MIEIITEHVDMPDLFERRYQRKSIDRNGKKWNVIDTESNKVVYSGDYENASLVCHNFNKTFYRDSCYCGNPIDRDNPDCVEFKLCKEHESDS